MNPSSLWELPSRSPGRTNEPVLVLASSDMNHYESDQVTRVKDHKAIEQILALNPRGLYDVVMKKTSASQKWYAA